MTHVESLYISDAIPTAIRDSLPSINRCLTSLTIIHRVIDDIVLVQTSRTVVRSILGVLTNLKRLLMPQYAFVPADDDDEHKEPPLEACSQLEEMAVSILDMDIKAAQVYKQLFPALRSLQLDSIYTDKRPKSLFLTKAECDLEHLITHFPGVTKWNIMFKHAKLAIPVHTSVTHVTHLTLRIVCNNNNNGSDEVDLRSLAHFKTLTYLDIVNRNSRLLLPVMESVRDYTYSASSGAVLWKLKEDASRTAFPNLETFHCSSGVMMASLSNTMLLFDDMPRLTHVNFMNEPLPAQLVHKLVSENGRRTWPSLTHLSTSKFCLCLVGATEETFVTIYQSKHVDSIVTADVACLWNDSLRPYRLIHCL